MRTYLRHGVAVAALLSTVGIAAAAGASATPKATDSLGLTTAQQHAIWQDVSKLNMSMKSPSGFSATIGAAIPGSVQLHPLPTQVTNQIPATRPYEYAMLDKKQVLIVNPADKKVAQIITQ